MLQAIAWRNPLSIVLKQFSRMMWIRYSAAIVLYFCFFFTFRTCHSLHHFSTSLRNRSLLKLSLVLLRVFISLKYPPFRLSSISRWTSGILHLERINSHRNVFHSPYFQLRFYTSSYTFLHFRCKESHRSQYILVIILFGASSCKFSFFWKIGFIYGSSNWAFWRSSQDQGSTAVKVIALAWIYFFGQYLTSVFMQCLHFWGPGRLEKVCISVTCSIST